MKWIISLSLSVLLFAPGRLLGQEEKKGAPETKPSADLKDALEILKKADAACKALQAVKYDLVVEPAGESRENAFRCQATVTGQRIPEKDDILGLGQRFLVEARIMMPGSGETQRVTVGSDGQKCFVIRHDAKKAHEGDDPAVLGPIGQSVVPAMMLEYLHPSPYSDEINGKKQELVGSKTIEGVDCYEIHVVYAVSVAPDTTWFISKKDFVPMRRIDETSAKEGKKSRVEKTASKLELNPKVDADIFKLKLPEGFTKTSEPAP